MEPLNDRRRFSPADAYQAGLAAFESGRFSEAIEHLEPIADGRHLAATLGRFYLGQAHFRLGVEELRARRFESALRHLGEARRINPDSTDIAGYLATCHQALGRRDLVIFELEKERPTGDPSGTLPIRLAHAFAGDGQFERAIETLESAIRSAPRRADLRFQLGIIHVAREDHPTAIAHLREAVALAPRDAEIARHLALSLGAAGKIAESASWLAAAQRLAPADAYTAWLLALAMRGAQEAGSEPSTEMISAISPAVDARSLDSLAETIIAEPDFVEAFLSLPPSEVDRELFSALVATMERALERQPDYADLHHHCARLHERLGRMDEAIRESRRALEINPRYVQALIQLGRMYARTDRALAAIARLEEAVAQGGDYPDVNCLLGELYRGQGNLNAARARYERALELNANYRRAREGLEAVAVGG